MQALIGSVSSLFTGN